MFHGLRVAPFRSDSVNATVPNSGVFVFPTITNPASRMRLTTAESKSGTFSAYAWDEYVVRMPAVDARSLTPMGTPRKGASPLVESIRAAVASASSPQTVTNALSVGSSWSMRASESSTSSRDETSPSRTSRACSTAERNASSITRRYPVAVGDRAPLY